MIPIKSASQVKLMREACRITGEALALAGRAVQPGITTGELDHIVRSYIEKCGARPTFLGYGGFPGSACISVNEVVIHGIPGKRRIREGDIVSLDVGAQINGFTGDSAATFAAGTPSEEARKLMEVTRQSFFEGMKFAREGYRVSDISHAIQTYVEAQGFSLVREYTGHGVGARLHEEPEVPNFGPPGHGARLRRGMVLAVEPMVCAGSPAIRVLPDKWTVVTQDGKLAAHYEHSVLITDGDPEFLTMLSEDALQKLYEAHP